MSTLTRYVLFQVPGWAGCLLAGAVVVHFGGPAWVPLALLLVWMAKDAVLYPMLRDAYGGDQPTGAASMVGETGRTRLGLDPHGWVTVRGERWRARLESTDASVPAGAKLRIVDGRGLELVVRPEGENHE